MSLIGKMEVVTAFLEAGVLSLQYYFETCLLVPRISLRNKNTLIACFVAAFIQIEFFISFPAKVTQSMKYSLGNNYIRNKLEFWVIFSS